MEDINFKNFAEAFPEGNLNNRRIFVSGCDLGNMALATELFKRNGGMYSLSGPTKPIFINQSAIFWSAFYYTMDAYDSQAMKKETLEKVFNILCSTFNVPIAHFFKNTKKNAAVDRQTFAAVDIFSSES